MTAIYQSPFLLALGWTIAASLWQAALLWMVYQVLASTSNKLSPSVKHNLALTGILFTFGWFVVTLSAKYNEFQQLLPVSGLLATDGAAIDTSSDMDGFMFTALLNQYLPYISASYLLVLTLLAIRLVKAYLYTQRIKTKGLQEIDEYWANKVERYTGYLRIHKKVRIYLSNYIDVPATLSFFKPVILLPVAAFTQLSPQQVESIILHELAHIKRNDYLINIVVSAIETILFFNPFVHLLGKSLKKEREHSCDDFVLHFRFDPHSYASALLSLEKLRIHTTPAGAIAATGNSQQLLGRVKRIMNVKNTGFNYGQKLLVLLITAFILVSVAWLSPDTSQNNASEEKTPETAAVEEECIDENKEQVKSVVGKTMEIQAATRKPVAAKTGNTTTIVKVITPVSPGAKPRAAELNTFNERLLAAPPAVPSQPAQPYPAPQFEFHSSLPFLMLDDKKMNTPDELYFSQNLPEIYKEFELKEEAVTMFDTESPDRKKTDKKRALSALLGLLKEKGIDLKEGEVKLQQLELLLNNNFFEHIDLNFETNDKFGIDFKVKKTAPKKRERGEKIKERKNTHQFNWNDDNEGRKIIYQNKMRLDSARERTLKMAEQQKELWLRKAESSRQIQNAIQQTYANIIAVQDGNDKARNLRRQQNERKRAVTLAMGNTNNHRADEHNSNMDYSRRSKAQVTTAADVDVDVASVRQVSRVVIDTGKGNTTVVISIE